MIDELLQRQAVRGHVTGSTCPTSSLPAAALPGCPRSCPSRLRLSLRNPLPPVHVSRVESSKEPPTRSVRKVAGVSGLLLQQAPVLQAPDALSRPRLAQFRFWYDEKRFRGTGDVALAQHMLFAAGGIRTGGNFKESSAQGPMGWQQTHKWDILWSTSDGNLKAAPFIKPGQLISALPGMESITKKRHLAVTLQAAYGEAAWSMLPRTYSIPAQLLDWRQRLADEAAAAAALPHIPAADATAEMASAPSADTTAACPSGTDLSSGYWVLKTGAHLGEGLQVVPASKALTTLLERNKPYLKPPGSIPAPQPTDSSTGSESSDSDTSSAWPPRGAPRPFICVQQYITNPLLIHGHKFGLRLWVLVIGPTPFRAYLYGNGLVLFSTEQYNANMQQVEEEGAETQGHLTNHAQNQSGDVWPLQQLFDLLGPQKSEQLWDKLSDTAGRVVAAAAGHVKASAHELQLPEECAFELLGLDFLLDGSLQPWLLEVNASPSLAWRHADPSTAATMKQIKQELLCDLASLLRLQDRYPVTHLEDLEQSGSQDLQQRVEQQERVYGQESSALQFASVRGSSSRCGKPRGEQGLDANTVLMQAASASYFDSRPDVRQLVQEGAQILQRAVAAAPTQQLAEEQVQQVISQLQTNPQQALPVNAAQNIGPSCSGADSSRLQDIDCAVNYQDDILQHLRSHADRLAQLEAEFQSCGKWQSLFGCMRAGNSMGGQHALECAVQLYWSLRAGSSCL